VRLRCADGGELLLQASLDRDCLPVLSDIGGTETDSVCRQVASNVEHLFDLQKADARCLLYKNSVRPREAWPRYIHRINGSDPVCHGNTEVEAPTPVICTFETRVADILFAVQLAPDL
jgi:hypothetical protein